MADIWDLVWGKPSVDPQALADAIAVAAAGDDLDYRTRLLIRDGTQALESYWGCRRFHSWLERCPARRQIEDILNEPFAEVGFPSLKERLVDATSPATVRQYLRELSLHIRHPTRFVIGGSVVLILAGQLSRSTDAIDVVDEVPEEIREQHQVLDRLQKSYGLCLTHFLSHFLPSGWDARVHSLEPFGKLQASVVDVYDVFLSKLFSARDKDRDDLRILLPALDVDTVKNRLHDTCASFLADPLLRQNAERNWFVLTGEKLE